MREVEHYFCGDCENYTNCQCRIDHKSIKFAKPWFVADDRHQCSGTICSDFHPAHWKPYACREWQGFEEYWPNYVEQWIPYGNTNTLTYFTLRDDTSVRYGVPLLDFVYGNMIEGNKLKAVEKMYYKRTRNSPIGYELIREKIDGVEIEGYQP